MLITFTSPIHSDVTMFGDVAKRILKLMGQSGAIPGAIAAEDVADVLEHFKNELNIAQSKEPQSNNEAEEEENKEPAVGIAVRAFPLVEMMEAAVAENSTVMWYERKG